MKKTLLVLLALFNLSLSTILKSASYNGTKLEELFENIKDDESDLTSNEDFEREELFDTEDDESAVDYDFDQQLMMDMATDPNSERYAFQIKELEEWYLKIQPHSCIENVKEKALELWLNSDILLHEMYIKVLNSEVIKQRAAQKIELNLPAIPSEWLESTLAGPENNRVILSLKLSLSGQNDENIRRFPQTLAHLSTLNVLELHDLPRENHEFAQELAGALQNLVNLKSLKILDTHFSHDIKNRIRAAAPRSCNLKFISI